MEESSFQAIYTGVYIVVFIAALTTTLYLFNGINTLSENSYEYGNVITGQTLIEAPNYNELNLDGNDIISYYFNYVKKDRYEASDIPSNLPSVDMMSNTNISNYNYSYSTLINKVQSKNYYLKANGTNSFTIIEK